MGRADLHIHTTASDGALTPAQVVREAAAAGLSFLSITDHNTLLGLEEAGSAASEGGPKLILGVELSSQPDRGDELHVLGYGIDPASAELVEACREISRRKNEQMWQIVRRLRHAGVGIEVGDLPLRDDEQYVGRPVLAERLIENGVVNSRRQAFHRFLGAGGGAYVPMEQFSPGRCIDAIHAAGGLAVLAHPTIATVDRWIEPLSRSGLDGVEAYRPGRRGNQQLYMEKAAEHFGLFTTGGSDWHGRSDEQPLGEFCVSADQISAFFAALTVACRREPDGS